MKWVSVNCASSEFIIKADDDVYINIYNLLKRKNILSNYAKRRNKKLIFGRRGDINPVRDPKGKWYLPTSIYSKLYLPEYISGVAYIVSTVTCDSLFRAVVDSTPVLVFEDTTLTGTAGSKVGALRVYDDEEPSLKTYYLNLTASTLSEYLMKKIMPHKSDLRNTFYIGNYMKETHLKIIHEFVKANQYFTEDKLKREFYKHAPGDLSQKLS